MGLFGRTEYESAFDPDEQSSARVAVGRFFALGRDLPFVPVRPYEHRRLQLGWRAALLGVLVIGLFFGTLGSEPLWQDEQVLRDVALRSWGGITAIWTHPFDQAIAPAVRSTNWLVGRTAGLGVMQLRLATLAFHAIAVVMLWLSLRRLNVKAAWLAAAVLAIHPAVLPTVGWISRQGDVLAAACSATTVWAYLRARDIRPALNESIWTDPNYHADEDSQPRWPWGLFALAMFGGLASGSVAAAIAPMGLLAIGIGRGTRLPRGLLILLIALAVASIASAWWFAANPNPAKIETAAAAGATATQLIAPIDLPIVLDRSQWSGSWIIAAAVVACVIAIVALVRWRAAWGMLVLIGVVVAAVHGALAKPPVPAAIVSADLVAYPALFVLIPVFVVSVISLATRPLATGSALGMRWGLGLLILGSMGTLSVLRSPAYAEPDAIWQHALAIDPDGVIAREELANRYLAQGYLEEAGSQLDRVPESRRDVHWLLSRGKAHEAQKQYIDAANCYETAHQADPANTEVLILLAEARASAGQPDQAAVLYDLALQRSKNDAGLLTNAGLTQVRLGKLQSAAGLYEQALKIDPRFLPAHINLANVLFDLGQFEQSANHLQEAVRIDPRNFPAFMNAGILLYRLKDFPRAERMFRAAVNLDSTSPDAFDDLGIVLAAQGKLSDAAWSFTQAIRLNPDHAAAEHLAEVRRQLRAQAATQPTRSGTSPR